MEKTGNGTRQLYRNTNTCRPTDDDDDEDGH